MEAIETYEHAGLTVKIYYDEHPSSPADWDNLGTLVAFDRDVGFAEQQAEHQEEDAVSRGGAALLVRYLRVTSGAIAVPFRFNDYGSGGARIYASDLDDERPSGFMFTTHERVDELCGKDAKFHTDEWIIDALKGELEVWDQYVQGDVYGYELTRDGQDITDGSLWGIYGFEYAKEEANGAAEFEQRWEAEQVVKIDRMMAL